MPLTRRQILLLFVLILIGLGLGFALSWSQDARAAAVQRTYFPAVGNGAPEPCGIDVVYDLKVPKGYETFRGADISGPICFNDGSFLWAATGRRPDGFFGVLLFRQRITGVENVKLPRDVEGRGQLSREGDGVWLIAHDTNQSVIMRVSP